MIYCSIAAPKDRCQEGTSGPGCRPQPQPKVTAAAPRSLQPTQHRAGNEQNSTGHSLPLQAKPG